MIYIPAYHKYTLLEKISHAARVVAVVVTAFGIWALLIGFLFAAFPTAY